MKIPSPSVHINLLIHTLDTVTIEELDIFCLLAKLHMGKSVISDEIQPRLLKQLANFDTNPSIICSSLSVTQGRLMKD